MPTQPADNSSLRRHNELLVLRCVQREQPVSMISMSHRFGMQPSTISRLVRHLESRGLLISVGQADPESGGGRPAVQWRINGLHASSLGLYLSSNLISGVILGLDHSIKAHCVIPFDGVHEDSAAHLSGLIRRAVETLLEPKGASNLAGVGIASMGLASVRSPVVRYFDLDLDFEQILAPLVDVPVLIDNDANVLARGEVNHGLLDGVRDALILYAHEGIGAGIIANGRLLRGFGGGAGEVAHHSHTLLPDILSQGDESVWRQFCEGVCAMINLLNPEVCLLTGDFHNLKTPGGEPLEDRLRDAIDSRTNPVAQRVRLMSAGRNPMDIANHMAKHVFDQFIFHQLEVRSIDPAAGRGTYQPSPNPRNGDAKERVRKGGASEISI